MESYFFFRIPCGQIFKKICNMGGKHFEHKCYRLFYLMFCSVVKLVFGLEIEKHGTQPE